MPAAPAAGDRSVDALPTPRDLRRRSARGTPRRSAVRGRAAVGRQGAPGIALRSRPGRVLAPARSAPGALARGPGESRWSAQRELGVAPSLRCALSSRALAIAHPARGVSYDVARSRLHGREVLSWAEVARLEGLTAGVSQWLSQGLSRGLSQGALAARREVPLQLARQRFGALPADVSSAIATVESDPLERALGRLLSAGSALALFAP